MARPKKEIDWGQVEKLCAIQCTQEEIAQFFECCLDTLQNRSKDEMGVSFSEFYRQKRGLGKISLRRSQWQLAVGDKFSKPNVAMAIWLGKQHLGQSDQPTDDDKVEKYDRPESMKADEKTEGSE